MTNTIITNPNPELTKNHIIQLLEQLTIDYQKTLEERKLINSEFSPSEDEFNLWEEIELLTTDIRVYASQIKFRGDIENPQQVMAILQQMRLFDIQNIANFYFHDFSQYSKIKSYLRMLDYLLLLILEYLNLSQVN